MCLYSIGLFSQMTRVTPKALRHYDEIGLLRPERIDPDTGYRYYSSAQLPRVFRIMAFKQMGLSLAEITALLEAGCPDDAVEKILRLKRAETEAALAQDARRLRLIDNFLDAGKGFFMNDYTAMIRGLPSVSIAYITRTIPGYEALNDLMPNVLGAGMERAGCRCAEPDYCFNRYLDSEYRDRDIHVEICQAVTELKPDNGEVRFKTLPAVPTAVCVLHKGPYERLGEAYSFAMKWAGENGYRISDLIRESYIDGIWNKETPEDYLTELQVPVEKA